MSRIGIVTGLRSERAIVLAASRRLPARRQPLIACAGADPQRAHEEATRLAGEGAQALLSFGIAGGLDPALRPGAVVIADRVILTEPAPAPSAPPAMASGGLGYETSPHWQATVAGRLATGVVAPVLGAARAIANAEEKTALYRGTGAVAVDMESGGVAQAAVRLEIPFLVVRVVADPAWRSVPVSAFAGLAPDGGTRPGAVLIKLARRPWELPALVGLALDTASAMRSLRRVAARCDAVLVGPPG